MKRRTMKKRASREERWWRLDEKRQRGHHLRWQNAHRLGRWVACAEADAADFLWLHVVTTQTFAATGAP